MEKYLFEALLHGEGKIHVALRNFSSRLAWLAEEFFHLLGEMPRQLHRSIRQDLHSLIASQWLEVTQIKLESSTRHGNDLPKLISISIILLAVRSKTHHLTFIAVLRISDKFADHCVKTTQRVRQKNTVEHFDLVALAARHHRGNEVARTVVTEACRLLPRRTVVRAGDVREMMLYVVLLKPKLRGRNVESFRDQRTHIAHTLFALTQVHEVQKL